MASARESSLSSFPYRFKISCRESFAALRHSRPDTSMETLAPTRGAISALFRSVGEAPKKPVLQVIDVKHLAVPEGQPKRIK